MREIKFRAWDKSKKKMCEVLEFDWFCNSGCTKKTPSNVKVQRIINDEDGKYCRTDEYDDISDSFELMQFTELKDKNGKEIYEGDVVSIDWEDNRYGAQKGVVEWDEQNAGWDFGAGTVSELEWTHEVIGNKFENPELLKEK